MGKSLGIVAFVLCLLSYPLPVIGPWLCVLALLLASAAALAGERTWAVVVAVLGGLNLFFLSPSWMFLMYSHHLAEGAGAYGNAVAAQQRGTNTFMWYFTLAIVLAPVAIVARKSFSGTKPKSERPVRRVDD